MSRHPVEITALHDRYGGPWQELRAYLATVLIGWAQTAHFRATMDVARALTAIEDEVVDHASTYASRCGPSQSGPEPS